MKVWGYGPVVESLLSVLKALGSTPQASADILSLVCPLVVLILWRHI